MQVLVIAAFSYWFAVLSGIPIYISGVLFKFGIRKKIGTGEMAIRLYPIDCEKCLAFWLGLGYFWGQDGFIVLAGVTSFTAIVIGLLINKLR